MRQPAPSRTASILRYGILAFGVLLLLHEIFYFADEAMRMSRWTGTGGLRTRLHPLQESGPWIFRSVDVDDFPGEVIPSPGDTLVSIDGISTDSTAFMAHLVRSVEIGATVMLTYLRGGDEAAVEAIARPLPVMIVRYLIITQIFRAILALAYLSVGLWAFLSRSQTAGVRLLSLFCFSMSSTLVVGVLVAELSGIDSFLHLPWMPAVITVMQVCATLFGAFWLHLQLVFPRPVSLLRRRPWLTRSLVYLPLLGSMAIGVFHEKSGEGFGQVIISVQILAGIGLLIRRRSHTTVPLERRQMSIVLWGSGVGLTVILLWVVIGTIPHLIIRLPMLVRMLLPNLTFLALLLSPISFAYAFGRYRLLEVQAKLRRGTRYLIGTAILLLFLLLFLYSVSYILLEVFNVGNQAPTVVLVLLLALSVAPMHRRAQRSVENRFYPERARLRLALDSLLTPVQAIHDIDTLWDRFEQHLRSGIGAVSVLPVFIDEERQVIHSRGGSLPLLAYGGALVEELAEASTPLMVDELGASGRISRSDDSWRWLRENDIDMVIPMTARGRLMGFVALVLGGDHREDVSPESLSPLFRLVSQVTLVHENLRLLEENLDKRRLEEQLAMARQVQEQFLPKVLPPTPGLEVAAICEFSQEVAGDYYDVIPISDASTLLVVADVAGKGAGAAMLMANLRASLRTISSPDIELDRLAARLNTVIHQDTSSEQFITFFAGIYNTTDHTLTFVNAGHNSPRIIRADSTIEQLVSSGLPLGVFGESVYGVSEFHLESGDLLIAFTDGVSEAMNDQEEEFSEERIIQIMTDYRQSSTVDLVNSVKQAVIAHTGDTSFTDDFTLLVARVL